MFENFTVEKIEFKMKTQAMMNFAPMIFDIRQPRRRDMQRTEASYWNEEVQKQLGSNFITVIDEQKALHQIRVNQFLKEYQRIQQAFESAPGLIKDTFTLLQEGLVRVNFERVMQMAYDKYAMQVKMRSRSGL